MIQSADGHLLNLSIFGSASRGDSDELSDLDIIAVVADGAGKYNERRLQGELDSHFGRKVSISFYGVKRLSEMFNAGDLFAWHLYHESKPLFRFDTIQSWFGKPHDYTWALDDINSLILLLRDIPSAIEKYPANCRFEAGVAYICARNIAISASWCLNRQPIFGRYAPYDLSNVEFPLERGDYKRLIMCRIWGQRANIQPPSIESDELLQYVSAIDHWAGAVNALITEPVGKFN